MEVEGYILGRCPIAAVHAEGKPYEDLQDGERDEYAGPRMHLRELIHGAGPVHGTVPASHAHVLVQFVLLARAAPAWP